MEKESYNIDDILSEVKKRREEQEIALKNEGSEKEEKKAEAKEIKEEQLPKKEKTAQLEKQAPVRIIDEEPAAEEKPVFDEVVITKEDTEAEAEKPVKDNASEETQKNPEKDPENITEENNEDNKMVDILQLSQADKESPLLSENEDEELVKEKFFKTKKGKMIKAIIIILVILIVGAGAFAAYYIDNMLNDLTENDDNESYTATEYYDGMDFLQEDFPMIEEQSASDVYSYKEYLKYWYENGDPVRSSHVLNILLIGEDTREEEITDTSRADSAIVVSINIDTNKIYMTSILRDLYVYYEVNGNGYYGKINESAANGGMNTYITTLERYYKISIDNYAVVNFASFPKIIDALGGVEIALTSSEVYEVNNHPSRYSNVTLPDAEYDENGEHAKVLLSGEQALAYCRIRKIDSDNARADRQKTVLSELFNSFQGTGTLDAVKIVNKLSQYTKTGYTKKELISIGNLALKDGWLNYDIETTNVPSTENSLGGQYFSVSYNNWIWLADIPKDAYELQLLIYGKSNIQLSENRPDYISMGK